MTVSGSTYFNPLFPDKSELAPVIKPNQSSSAHFEMLTKDELASSGTDAFATLPANFPISERGQLSLADFAKVINENLAAYTQSQDAAIELDNLMNRRLGTSLSDTALALRKYRSKILSYLVSCKNLVDEANRLIHDVNGTIHKYNDGVQEDSRQIKIVNDAISQYNAMESHRYSDVQSLQEVVKKFGDYVERSGRNRVIDELNDQLRVYHVAIEEYNLEIDRINPEMSFFHLFSFKHFNPIQEILPIPLSTDLEAVNGVSLIDYRPKQLPMMSKIAGIDLHKLMRDAYDPVFNAAIGYMSDISNVFDVPKVCKSFGRSMIKSAFVTMIDPALSRLAGGFVQRFGDLSRTNSAMRIGISWNTLDRILAGTSIAASMLEARIPLMPLEFDVIQLTTLNFLVKGTIQSSTGLSFALLGQDLSRSTVEETQLSVALALAYVKRLGSVVGGDVIDKNIESLVENHPRLLTFPEPNRRLLIRRLSSIVKLGLLQNGLVQMSIALETPGLTGQILSIALAQSGIKKTINQLTFNDLINERSLVVKVQAKLADELILEGISEEDACRIVETALGRCVQNTPYSTIEEFTNYLTVHFIHAGIKQIEKARIMAVKASGYMMSLFPRCLPVAPKLHAGLTLSLVDPKVLLSRKAIQTVLEGYDLDVFQRIYENAIAELYVVVDLKRLLKYLAVDPLMHNIEEHPPPMTLRQVLVDLYRVLLRQGLGVDDCLQIAEQMLKYLVHSPEAQVGFNYPPNMLKVIQYTIYKLFLQFGLEDSEAIELSQHFTVAGMGCPEELSDLSTFVRIEKSLERCLAERGNFDEKTVSDVMREEGISEKLSNMLSKIIVPLGGEFKLPSGSSMELSNSVSAVEGKKSDSKIDAPITKVLVRFAGENESTAHQVLTEAILSSSVIGTLAEKGEIELMEITGSITRISKLFFEKAVNLPDETAFRSVLIQMMVDELRYLDSREAAAIAEEISINDVMRREVFLKNLLVAAHKFVGTDEKTEKRLRSVVYELYRSEIELTNQTQVREVLVQLLKESRCVPENIIPPLVDTVKIGVPLTGESSIWTNDFTPVLSQNDLREQLTNCMMDHFRNAISLEKAEILSDELILTLLGSMNAAQVESEGKPILGLIVEQVEELVMRAGSKQYKKIILDGVVDTMSSSARINFDMFLFTELLNMNGKSFLQLIQEVLLHNVGLEDRSVDKTIDLLI